MVNEEWRDVSGFEGLYQVSNSGRVKSLARAVPSARGWKLRIKERILKPFSTSRGYLYVLLSKGNIQSQKAIHRLVLDSFVGPCPEGMQVAHEDGVPSNNSVGNLSYKTPLANIADKRRHGTMPMGETHQGAKLTESDVRLVRQLYGSKSLSNIAKQFGVSRGCITNIVYRHSWSYI